MQQGMDHNAETGGAVIANTFLIGAQKAGTTYLAALLDQKPEICVSDPKEPNFFTSHYEDGFDAYARCFRDPLAPIRLDASTTYTFLRSRRDMNRPDAPGIADPIPERIARACPEARFIYVLRDPVKRAASAWRHWLRLVPPSEGSRSLMEGFEIDPILAVASRYADQIERYLEVFPRDRFLFVDFRRLTGETQDVLEEVCDFLGCSAEGIVLDEADRAKHGAHRITAAGKIIRQGMKVSPGLARLAKGAISAGVKSRFLDPITKAPANFKFYDEAQAYALFEEDRARVEALTGLKI